ncbi:MAG: HAD-IIB family hydrolase, partial [Moorea sp. SIO2B7]|nr:HAD-IIB family hydrolase [Moorena sp. SIO2B7]
QNGLNVKLIYSGGKDLDILPKRGDKGLAVKFLRQKWGIAPQRTVVCGDSGNDIAMLSIEEEPSIIVGNAQPELLQWYEFNQNDYLYLAQAYCASGILEGLKYFGFL